ncbi:hypothetical protein PITCH_A290005 [uncultured Desulfobacterium sp.]|uniref:Thioredoxin domain-containing protein n=1 Tax=uncultured Desulfobacterium sp. TaxID=201089 RepID=A0A445MZ54_9BACT|nr:hypothetical protein PITCH_A290005 [uncultured Desulfobacterium sp.]
MNMETRAWLYHQFKGLVLITVISLILAVGTNIFRSDPVQWVEKRKFLKAGDRFPYVPFPSSHVSGYKDYLGLPTDKEIITISDFKTDLLLIEVLNVFCFPCQTQSLVLNNLRQLIEERPDLRNRVKIMGVAMGNTKEAVTDFVSTYGLKFPVIPDPEVRSEKIVCPGIYTPFSIFIRLNVSEKNGLVAGTHPGLIEDQQVMLEGLLTLLTAEPGSIGMENLFKTEKRQ